MSLFTAEAVDSCLDPSRKLGDIPPHTALIAGLDPQVQDTGSSISI